MITVSITRLRRNLFDFIARASAGETIIVKRKGREVARIVAIRESDWRNHTRIKPKLKTDPGQAFAPLEDIWEDYV